MPTSLTKRERVMSAVGWSAVGIYLLLALGFAYFQFMKPSAS